MRNNRQVPPMCRNCLHVCWTVDNAKPMKQRRTYICGDGMYAGTILYPWDICPDYKKRYHRNRQIDFQDVKETYDNEKMDQNR